MSDDPTTNTSRRRMVRSGYAGSPQSCPRRDPRETSEGSAGPAVAGEDRPGLGAFLEVRVAHAKSGASPGRARPSRSGSRARQALRLAARRAERARRYLRPSHSSITDLQDARIATGTASTERSGIPSPVRERDRVRIRSVREGARSHGASRAFSILTRPVLTPTLSRSGEGARVRPAGISVSDIAGGSRLGEGAGRRGTRPRTGVRRSRPCQPGTRSPTLAGLVGGSRGARAGDGYRHDAGDQPGHHPGRRHRGDGGELPSPPSARRRRRSTG